MAAGVLTVNIGSLCANWQMLNNKVGAAVRCAAVVKANAYGLGVEPVVKNLFKAGCREFFLATLHEAIAVRQALGSMEPTIYVLGGLSHDEAFPAVSSEWQEYQLRPVLISANHVERWMQALKNAALPKCAIKIDTGMHRLGLTLQDFESLIEKKSIATNSVSLVMSHFACADTADHPLNQDQLVQFQRAVRMMSASLPNILYSMANSSGLFLDAQPYFDMVRPGAALYGVNPTPKQSNPMLPVVTLSLPIMQIKTIERGSSVGYGATFTADRQLTVAVVFSGYADGLFRYMGNRGAVLAKGVRCAIVGRISMDSFVVDVSLLSPEQLAGLQDVEILNAQQTVDDVAVMANTIGYEVLTSLGQRYTRRYMHVCEE